MRRPDCSRALEYEPEPAEDADCDFAGQKFDGIPGSLDCDVLSDTPSGIFGPNAIDACSEAERRIDESDDGSFGEVGISQPDSRVGQVRGTIRYGRKIDSDIVMSCS